MMSHPRVTASACVGFFSLPIEIRNDIYKRILVLPHPIHLFQDPGCAVQSFLPEKPYEWLALLYTNRQISEEARAVLYGSNKFSFEEVESWKPQGSLLNSFLSCIGSVGAGSLSSLSMNFPATEQIEGRSGEIEIRDDSLQSLRLLQNKCIKLNTLEILIFSKKTSRLITEDQTFARGVFLEINAQLRRINSLNNIILRACSDSPAPSVTEFLHGLGWIILVE
jgi:hypothetical protein